ncbi:MAG: HAD-IIIA family hydrolase [Burkholderiales bacterium]|nr:HAD-IIIA family hydrolase [Burkholderiales bacterium]
MKLIVIDRDCVMSQDADMHEHGVSAWQTRDSAIAEIARLNQSDYRVVITSNQPGIAKEQFDMKTLNAVHNKLHRTAQALGAHIDAIFFCPHAALDDCDCRQPKPGVLQTIGKRFDLSLKYVAVVGDTLPVLQAAFAVGSVPYLLLSKTGLSTKEKGGLPPSTIEMQDLRAVVDSLNQREQLAVEMVEAARHALHKKK